MLRSSPQGGIKVVYVAGTSRCGSTLLGRVLGQADGLHAPGELNLLWRRGLLGNELCSCGRPFRDCPFWQAVFQHAYGGFDRVDAQGMVDFLYRTARPRRLPNLLLARRVGRPVASSDPVSPYLETLGRLYQAIAELTESSVIVDTSKHAAYALLLSGVSTIDLHVLHLVRDSRAVSFSWQRQRVRVQKAGQNVYMGRRSLANAAFAWTRGNLYSELLRFGAPRYSRLRYEDFAQSPKAAMAWIADALGQPLTGLPFVDDHAIELQDSHLVSGNPVRYEQGQLAIRVDDEWRRKLPPQARQLVTALTVPLLLRYQYLGRPRGARRRCAQ